VTAHGEKNRRDDGSTRELIDRVANKAARQAAQEAVPTAIEAAFKSLGMDATDPLTMQKNMAFLEESRKRCEKFYGTMWDNLTALFWRVIRWFLILAAVGLLAAMGMKIDAINALLLDWIV